ncbi:MAG: replication initiation protein [Tabrizicola sp.]|nr:replication initiation protein [Tabrizicola sp.]
MTKTTKVASDRAYDDTKTVLPAEFARGVYIQHAPSAQALKLMHLMIAVAGGRMAEDVMHEIKGSDIRQIKGIRKHSKESLVPLFAEIRAVTVIYDDTLTKQVTIGGFLDTAKVDYRYDDHGEIKVRWWFSRSFRDTAADSTHWAIMDRQTVFALRSKYAIQLFQHIASRTGQQFKNSERFSVHSLRAILAVPEGKLMRFADLNRRALAPAIDEINQLSRFTLSVRPIMDGRYIDEVEVSWEEKADATPAKRELDRPKAGRKARRDGSAETVTAGFPASGSIEFDERWKALKRAAGCNMDNAMIAEKFRAWCAGKGLALDAQNIEQAFSSFCAKVGRV